MLSSSCIQAEKEPVPTKTGDCQQLIRLKRPFCEHYGIKLDKYVNAPTWDQQERNNILWAAQDTTKRLAKLRSISISTECLQQSHYMACHYSRFQGCDRTTSVLQKKRICKESCVDFISQCGIAKLWEELNFINLNCSEQPSRSAGNSPECAFYARKMKNIKTEGNSIWYGILFS